MDHFKVIIVEDVKLELKGTEEIFRNEIPEAEIIGTAMSEDEFWSIIKDNVPDLVLLDLGLGGSTTIGVEICRKLRKQYAQLHVLIFTGEILNEKLWVDALDAGADGVILKTGELLTKASEAIVDYEIDEYDERFLRHLALGYTKDQIAQLRGMPFGVKSLEKRQNDLVNRLFRSNERTGVNATRLVTKALQLGIIDVNNLEADED